jgi:DNA-binding MarR family transcriptional regulator
LKPLQRDGIVEAAPESSASRAVGLRLSASGKETLAQAVLRWQAAQAEFEEKFGQDRARELRKSLFALTSAG